jgi:hypothetical protein
MATSNYDAVDPFKTCAHFMVCLDDVAGLPERQATIAGYLYTPSLSARMNRLTGLAVHTALGKLLAMPSPSALEDEK